MKPMWLMFVFFLLIGLACLALGVNDYIHEKAWFAQAQQADGTITAYDLHVRHDGKSEFCPRIEFTTKAGEPATTYGIVCPNQPDQSQIGRPVSVYYDPNNPSDTRSKGLLNEEGSGLFVGVIGFLFFSSIGSISLLATFLQNRRAAAKAAQWQRQASKSVLEQDAARYHANQRAAKKADRAQPHAAAPAHMPAAAQPMPDADEACLAQLKQQEAELQRKIDERRQQGQ